MPTSLAVRFRPNIGGFSAGLKARGEAQIQKNVEFTIDLDRSSLRELPRYRIVLISPFKRYSNPPSRHSTVLRAQTGRRFSRGLVAGRS